MGIAIERKNFKQHYIDTESENQKSGLIIIFFIFHSACLKCMPELKTLLIINFFFLLSTRDQLSRKKVTKNPKLVAVFDCKTIIVSYYNIINSLHYL